jgi:hypothetical protein
MQMSLIQWALAVSSVAALCLVLGALIAGKLRSSFPVFFTFVLFGVVQHFIELIAFQGSALTYFYVYWSLNAISMPLGFIVLYEVFSNALKTYPALVDLGKVLFRWAAVFLLMASVLTAFTTSGNQPKKIYTAVLLLERSIRLMQCGLLLLLVFLEARLGISWRSRGMSIGLGLGAFAAIDLGLSYLMSAFPAWTSFLDQLHGVCYIGVMSGMAASLLLPEPQAKAIPDLPGHLIFKRWNESLASCGPVGTVSVSMADSFIPGVEQAVERVLARKAIH